MAFKVYLVGGAVRDKLLGLPIKEKDWVVVGARAEDLLAKNYRRVGKDFPVFLHPETNEEYALARTERKTAPGYSGFAFSSSTDITLEEDLLRRDLTVNAIAEDEQGELIDPYHGREDLQGKILRHVSPAFIEDPVRILRIARFAARFSHLGFKIATETNQLMQKMVDNGEINALAAERVWQEWQKALSEKDPAMFFQILNDCGALSILFPEIKKNYQAVLQKLITAGHVSIDPKIRFVALMQALSLNEIQDLTKRFTIPNAYQQLSLLAKKILQKLNDCDSAEDYMQFLEELDIFRRPQRLQEFLLIANALGYKKPILMSLKKAAAAAQKISAKSLAQTRLNGERLGKAIRKERVKNIQACLSL